VLPYRRRLRVPWCRFQPGDVVTAVDGKPVTGAGDGAMLAGALRPGASVSVTVRRGDRQLPLAITLAP
jgi:general secretion pathway protein C